MHTIFISHNPKRNKIIVTLNMSHVIVTRHIATSEKTAFLTNELY